MNITHPTIHMQRAFRRGLPQVLCCLCLFLALGLTACQHETRAVQPLSTGPACTPPAGVNLDKALAQSRNDLQHPDCQVLFEDYFQALLEIAAGNPKPENKRLFSEFLVWANTSGLMNRIQAQDYYNRYFNTTFMALPDRYNLCSACTEKNQLQRDLEAELGQKEQGLLEACRDKDGYYQAARDFAELKDILQATCLACSQK